MAGVSHYYLLFIFGLSISAIYRNVESRCLRGEVLCDEDKCISLNKWCNKEKDCDDETDEKYCKTTGFFSFFSDSNPNKCDDQWHVCGNGICFPTSTRCDGHNHCEDSSDEEDCTFTAETAAQTSTENTQVSSSTTEVEEIFDVKTHSIYLIQANQTEIKVTESTPFRTTEFESTRLSESSTSISLDYYGRRIQAESKDKTNLLIQVTEPTTPLSRHRHGTRHGNRYSPRRFNVTPKLTTTLPTIFTTTSYSSYYQESSTEIRSHSFEGHYSNQNYNRSSYHPSTPATGFRNFNQSKERMTPSPKKQKESTTSRHPNSRHYDQNREIEGRTNHIYNKEGEKSNFYFQDNFHEKYCRPFAQNVHRAEVWVMKQHDRFDGWKENTPRALIALSLINNTFLSSRESNLLKKEFEIHLGMKIMRNASAPISLQRTAMFINALLATCSDPRDFNGINIVEDLKIRAAGKNDQQFVNPLVYLSLCLSDVTPQDKELQRLQWMLNPAFPNEEVSKDIQVLALSALACCQHLPALSFSFDNRLKELMKSTAQLILSRRLADGSFGNVYNTALILQAMFALNSTIDWQPEKSLQYLADSQLKDGSFGDFFATYLAITALSGRSLVHLRNTKCSTFSARKEISQRNPRGQFQRNKEIQFSVYFGHPRTRAITMTRSVPSEFSVFDIIRLIDNEDGRLRLKYENETGIFYVTSIYGIPNDSERGRYWHLYIKKPPLEKDYALKHGEMQTGGIGTYYPKESEHLVFWYH